jgi:hypothetical protein
MDAARAHRNLDEQHLGNLALGRTDFSGTLLRRSGTLQGPLSSTILVGRNLPASLWASMRRDMRERRH